MAEQQTLTLLLEDQLTLLIVVLIFSSTSTASCALVWAVPSGVATIVRRTSCLPVVPCVSGAVTVAGGDWEESARTFPLFFGILSGRCLYE
jgi:hypothetical protein